MFRRVFCVGLFLCLAFQQVNGAEYFVSKQGDDALGGTSWALAFLTIQRGVDALAAGDTLSIGPGEYFESVSRRNLGSASVDTIIRAEMSGTVVLRGDIPAPEFLPVEGYRFVYSASFDQEPLGILEHNELRTLTSKANVSELEFEPGFFHYDADAQMLYLSNENLGSPDQCRYTLAVTGTQGFELRAPQRVHVEGVTVTGFYPGWGILLTDPVSCMVRDCASFMNVGGIQLGPESESIGDAAGYGNVVDNCVCYGNSFGGIVRYGANDDIIRNCHVYKNVTEDQEHFGIMHYSDMHGTLLMQNNVAWGHNYNYSVKQGGQQEVLENCVGLGHIRIASEKMDHNLLDGANEYGNGNATADNVFYSSEQDLTNDVEFADSDNLDFRLQADSRFRGAAPDGSDRGPYPYQENIFYLSLAGNDEADGLSMRSSWRTLERAMTELSPGDTLYLSEGEYAGVLWNEVDATDFPIRICGRGRGTVVITNELTVSNGAGIEFDRLNFSTGVALSNGSDLSFNNCTFFGGAGGLNATSVSNLSVTHAVFVGTPLQLTESENVFLSGNMYANTNGPVILTDTTDSIRYSDYNNYQNTTTCWEVNDTAWSFSDLQDQHADLYSQTQDPELNIVNGVPTLGNHEPFRSTGPADTAMGIHYVYDAVPEPVTLVGPFLHSAHDTTVNIEWWCSYSGNFEISWGETPAMEHKIWRFRGGEERFNTYSLTGLTPGTTYYFKIDAVTPVYGGDSFASFYPEGVPLTVTTAATPAESRTLYVATDGDDGSSGESRVQAFKTLCHAADVIVPGDTVLIAGGSYNETVRMRVAGTQDRPITFRCISGEKVVHWGESLPRAFELIVKPNYRFDGFYFKGVDLWREGFVIKHSPGVQITRCFNAMISALECPGLLVKNCVLSGGWSALKVDWAWDPPEGEVPAIIENNVFVMTILRQVEADWPLILRKNIFCECIRGKAHQMLLDLPEGKRLMEESDNCFYVRWPAEEKMAVNDMPLYQHCALTGSSSFAANPMMRRVEGFVQGWFHYEIDDFDDFFATNPRVVLTATGLQPDAFSDFSLGVTNWPYNHAWAENFMQADEAAVALEVAGNDADALAAYTNMVNSLSMSDRLKSDVLKKASFCAQRLNEYGLAMELAERIPEEVVSMHRRMQLMLEQGQYTELLNTFSDEAMSWMSFHLSYAYPELEDVMGDLLYFRSLAYANSGDLVAAEADLKVMNDKRVDLSYSSGEAIHDQAWLRLGDFYRTFLKDDDQALEAYLSICSRTSPDGDPKPVSTGASDVLRNATDAACEMLRTDGRDAEAVELEESFSSALKAAEAAGFYLTANAGLDQQVALADDSVSLNGTVTWNRSQNLPGSVATIWSQLYGPSTATIFDAESVDSPVMFSDAGYYCFRLSAIEGERNVYDNVVISVNSDSSFLDDSLEENDAATEAATVYAGFYPMLNAQDDADWYKISLSEESILSIEVLFEHNRGDLDLQLYEADGTTLIAESMSAENNEAVSQTLHTGIYLLNVRPNQGLYNSNKYEMNIAVQSVFDADNDGMADAWEILHFGTTSAENGDPEGDWDGDGMSNLGEWISGTNPTNAISVFKMLGSLSYASETQCILSWSSESNQTYALLEVESLTNSFSASSMTNLPATPPINTITVDVHRATSFYRISTE